MRRHIRGIDHAVILVRDLDRARDTYARMGFTLTPRGYHSLGSQNHCIMFGRDYIELMALPATPPAAFQYFADFLTRGEGVGALALAAGVSAPCERRWRNQFRINRDPRSRTLRSPARWNSRDVRTRRRAGDRGHPPSRRRQESCG